jgi:hypothetical protein
VRTISFFHFEPSPDALWSGLLAGTVRTSALVLAQSTEMQGRVRDAFDRIVQQYNVAGGLEVPVSVKLASGLRPAMVG